ncbi:MAG: HU family DNA-binding protein [Athalassotoga sp.]|uniref:HU family DNA-binding protein n=2 Tax=Mesoaciditogaceae TaxID=1769717 RepID=UPI001379E860|nr:HU family DNA-binding protein [Athalassotoga saccharophila]BBJ27739.1 DNA-binding protein [Athalassotoga saccharophila]
MNKKELIDKVAEETGYHKKEIKDVVEGVLTSITKALADGEKVQLVGFGTFEVVKRSAREGRNPQTGKKIKIAERKVPKFRPGKAFKEEVK